MFIFLASEVVVDYQTCVICMEDLPPDQVIISVPYFLYYSHSFILIRYGL